MFALIHHRVPVQSTKYMLGTTVQKINGADLTLNHPMCDEKAF